MINLKGKTQDERLFDAVYQRVMDLINDLRPGEDDDFQTTLERYFWNYIEVNADSIVDSIIEDDEEVYEVYLGEPYEDEEYEED